jgi:hypothetical protein
MPQERDANWVVLTKEVDVPVNMRIGFTAKFLTIKVDGKFRRLTRIFVAHQLFDENVTKPNWDQR